MVNPEMARFLHFGGAAVLALALPIVWYPSRRRIPGSAIIVGLGAAILFAEVVVRGLLAGRVPFVGTYQNALFTAALLGAATTVVLVTAAPGVRHALARLVLPWALAALIYGAFFSADLLPIGAEGRGLLAAAHAVVGWIDFTVLVVAAMAAVGMLLDRPGAQPAWQPILTRCLGAGFALLTATMASGAVLSFGVFGSWYQWQIAETLAAALWLAYGFLLHAYLLFGWRDRRLAVLVLGVLPLALAAFWSWSLYSGTYHYFETIIGS